MKNIYNSLFVAFFLFVTNSTFVSQQNAYNAHYILNPFLLNPSLAGETESKLFLNYRRQWAGFLGAPETQNITFDKSLKKDILAIGLTMSNDNTNVVSSSSGYFTLKYKAKLSKIQNLNFGISLGALQNRINFDNIIADSPLESSLFNSQQNTSGFDMNFGLAYKLGRFSLGGVGLNLLESKLNYYDNYDSKKLSFSYIRHFNIHTSYNFKLNKKGFEMSPIIVMRGSQGMQPQFDGNIMFNFPSNFIVNLNYRHEIGYGLTLAVTLDNLLSVGYTYEMSSNSLQNESSGSHEFSVFYRVGKGLNGHSNETEMKKLKNQNIAILEKTDFILNDIEKLENESKSQKELLLSYIDGLKRLKDSIKNDELELQELIKNESLKNDLNSVFDSVKTKELVNKELSLLISEYNLKIKNNSDTLDKVILENNQDSEIIQKSEKVEQSKIIEDPKTNQNSETKYYCIIGACKKISDVKLFRQIVKREYNLDTEVVQNSLKSWYLIYSKSSNSLSPIKIELKKMKKINNKDIFIGNLWIYKSKS
jgi:type IX secretion system PorP/SprF family membrane protein